MLFITVILVLGLIAGWAGLRAAIVTEYTELGNAILALNEGYNIQAIQGMTGASMGSNPQDTTSTLTIASSTVLTASIDDVSIITTLAPIP